MTVSNADECRLLSFDLKVRHMMEHRNFPIHRDRFIRESPKINLSKQHIVKLAHLNSKYLFVGASYRQVRCYERKTPRLFVSF